LSADRRNCYLGDERQIIAQVGIARVAGFDCRHFAFAKQAQPPEKGKGKSVKPVWFVPDDFIGEIFGLCRAACAP
jgi:hypothetical protein